MRYAVASSIGGSGRTTLVLNLGLTLSRRGYRVLMIDADPQGSLGHLLGRRDEWVGLADVLSGRLDASRAVKRSNVSGLGLLPRGRLAPANVGTFERAVSAPGNLKPILAGLEAEYDVLLVDMPPGLGQVPRGVLALMNEVIVTARVEPMAARSLARLFTVLDLVRKSENPGLNVTGVLPTFVNERNSLSRNVLEEMRAAHFPLFDAGVPESELFVRASERGQPLQRFVGVASPELAPVEVVADAIEHRLQGAEPAEWDVPLPVPSARPGGTARANAYEFRLELNRLVSKTPFGIEQWYDFLDTLMASVGADAAFVTDAEGLVVASRGEFFGGEAEGIGTRLSIAFAQADRMEVESGCSKSVMIEFEERWLSGIGLPAADGSGFTIGVLGADPVPGRMRNEIRETMKSLVAGFSEVGAD
jgi:chromosome partitioning protein